MDPLTRTMLRHIEASEGDGSASVFERDGEAVARYQRADGSIVETTDRDAYTAVCRLCEELGYDLEG